MPSSMSYYQNKSRNHDKGWEKLESQAGMSSPEKMHVPTRGREMEAGWRQETVIDSEAHAIGEIMV